MTANLSCLMHHQLRLLFVFLILLQKSSQDPRVWSHHAILDRNEYFHLFWNPLEEEIVFQIQVKTRGWIALGFSHNGGMTGADIALAWIKDGEIYFQDRFAYNNSVPVIDASQDYKLLGGFENETHTVVTFSRRWETCDQSQDLVLGGDTVRIIWAFHPQDPADSRHITYHGVQTRGSRSLFLKEKPLLKILPEDLSHLKTWDLRARNTRLPNDDHTHYWCQIFKAPTLDRKHHMIGFEPIIQPGHETYVHHMVLYECHVGEDDSPQAWFEHHTSAEGSACYSPNMPPEWAFCLATNAWAWAVGSEGEILPPHVGMPLGEDFGGATYFMLETHYDNPAMHKDLVDTSGIRIFYTDRLRKYDTAMLLVGTEVNFLHLIPPVQPAFTTVGRCTSECTKQGLDEDGIFILNGVLHSHLAGRRMKLRHIRNGKELPVVLQDNNYDFNYQASRQPLNESHVLPGDELMLECTYQTSDRSKPTFGGLSTRDEMCLGFILYYPRSRLADCRSLPALQTVMKAFGIESIYGHSFEKLVEFMKDIGSAQTDGSGKLQQLLSVLAEETGHALPKLSNKAPLTEEEILSRPFYAVVGDDEDSIGQSDLAQKSIGGESNYRTLLSELLLSVRIESPPNIQNQTVGQHVLQIDWLNFTVAKTVESILFHGNHNTLCLAHGRKAIIPYDELPFPGINEVTDNNVTNSKCRQNVESHHSTKKLHKPKTLQRFIENSSKSLSTYCNILLFGVTLFWSLNRRYF